MKVLTIIVVLIIHLVVFINAVVYDAYSGKPATKSQLKLYEERNNTRYCTIKIEPCDVNDWRRIDGSCYDLKYPSRGAFLTPTVRLLQPVFSVDYEPRNTICGKPLPLARQIRTALLLEGNTNCLKLTLLVVHYIVFAIGDINSLHDTLNPVVNTTDCCTPEGRGNYACTPIKIPEHDPVHRYSGLRCQNLTRPQSFQYFGCREFGTPFTRTQFATQVFDLSQVYNFSPGFNKHIRQFKNGLLKYDLKTFKETGKIFPIGNHTKAYSKNCLLNQYPKESLCFVYQANAILGTVTMMIVFYRHHNYIAKQLQVLNPCWDDDRIFYTAREINIAVYMQIFLYELLPVLFGKRQMERDGLISRTGGFRDMYDENVSPQVSDIYVYVNRWFHVIQSPKAKFYDKNGHFLKTFPIVNCTGRPGLLANDDNFANALRGSFRQLSGGFRHTIAYDIAERVLGGMVFALDVAAADLQKGRYFGFQPYVKYRELCSKKKYKCFNDLRDVMSEERIYQLREVYKNLKDVELMAGLWSEKYKCGRVPPTLYCLMSEQLRRLFASDRHFYERPNRPHAFDEKQLRAIRKVTIAGVLCTNSDDILKIQPHAFYSINRKTNPLVECSSSKIGKLDLSPWKDQKCEKPEKQ